MKLESGMRISCKIKDVVINDARIQKEEEKYYICQNIKNGSDCKNKLGYKYSWKLNCTTEQGLSEVDVTDLKVPPITLDDVYKGCEVKDSAGSIYTVLARLEDVVFLSFAGGGKDCCRHGYTIHELKKYKYTVVSPVPEPTKRDKIMDMLKRINDTIAVPDDVQEQIADEILSLDEVQK